MSFESRSLATLGTKRKHDFELYGQDEKDWFCTVGFLPTDDPEARLYPAEIIDRALEIVDKAVES